MEPLSCPFLFCVQPYKGRIKKAKVQGAPGKFLDINSYELFVSNDGAFHARACFFFFGFNFESIVLNSQESP